MNIMEIKELIDKIDKSNISLFELKLDDNYLKMDKSELRSHGNFEPQKNTIDVVKEEVKLSDKSKEVATTVETFDSSEAQIEEKDLYIVNSPMVGTFYERPGSDLPPFVKIGDTVKSGDTLCIVEAMKLMNEIESDIDGEIVSIIAKNGEMIEYGEPLFKIRRK